MTLPPHGPPEITEAQQAATSLGEIADPTPDNVSRALQDYSPYAVAAAAASLSASGGGGSQPVRNVGQTELDANSVAVNNETVVIPWVFGDGDEAMLDLTMPTDPVPTEAGIYSYTLRVSQLGGGAGGVFRVLLVVDNDYYSITLDETGGATSAVAIAATWFSTAGSAMRVSIVNATADSFGANLYVQKVA